MIRSVVIAGDFQFPSGSATAARVRNLAGGFVDCGLNTRVLSLTPQLSNGTNGDRKGVFQGIYFEHLARDRAVATRANTYRNQGVFDKLRWFWRAYSCGGAASCRVQQLAASGDCDLLIVYGRSAWRLLPMVRSAHAMGIPVLLDVVEGHSNFGGFLGILNPVYWDWRAGLRWLPPNVDGAIAICQPLADRLRRQGILQELIVPSIENFADLPAAPHQPGTGEFRLLYVGALIARDNPGMLFEIIRRLVSLALPVKLQVVGKYEQIPEGRQMARRVCGDVALRDHIEFIGPLSDQKLAETRQRADGLMLLRRNSVAERESFPTRLVEYLQVGRPVCISDVGDVGRYLEHGEHAVLLDPDDLATASSAVADLVRSPDRGHALGLRGRLRAGECFDRRLHATRMLQFACGLPRVKDGR